MSEAERRKDVHKKIPKNANFNIYIICERNSKRESWKVMYTTGTGKANRLPLPALVTGITPAASPIDWIRLGETQVWPVS